MPNVFGDYESHPLVKYMRAVMPGSFGQATLSQFPDAVKLALLAMEYQGMPSELIKVAVHSAAAANASDLSAIDPDPASQAMLFNEIATKFYFILLPIADAVAAMPKAPPSTPAMMKLNFGPIGAQIVTCVKGGGTWKNGACVKPPIKLNFGPIGAEIVACVKAGGAWKGSTCATSRQGVLWSHPLQAFVPIAPAPPPSSNVGLYVAAAAVAAVGIVAYLKLRGPAAA